MKNTLLSILVLAALVATVQARDPIAYVINTNGESLSKINLASGVVTNDILPLGSDIFCYPNQIIVRDTLAYVVNSGTSEIQVVNLVSETTTRFIDLGDGVNPYWMDFHDDTTAYVTCLLINSLIRFNPMTGAVLDTLPVGKSPEGIVVIDNRAYIAVTGFDFGTFDYDPGKVAVFDLLGDTVLAEIEVGVNPQFLWLDNFNKLHVVCTGNYFSVFGGAYVIDPATNLVLDSLHLGGSPGQIAIGPDNVAYVAGGGFSPGGQGLLYAYDATTLTTLFDSQNPMVVDSGCTMATVFQDTTAFIGSFTDFVAQQSAAEGERDRWAVGTGPVHADFNYVPGDVDGNFSVDIGDIVFYVEYSFADGPPPVWPRWRADVDASGALDVADIVAMAEYSFSEGPAPKEGARWTRAN